MKRSAVAVLAVLTAALLVAGCGGGSGSSSSSTAPSGGGTTEGAPKEATAPNAPAGSKVISCNASSQLRATAVDCDTARATMAQWEQSPACALDPGASRGSCALGGFRCQAVTADKGIAVSCAGPEGDIAFIARRAG